MKTQMEKQQIAQLLSKFMAGETSVAEEDVLAQYFRTHEVDEEWAEYKEMFALFDDGKIDIDPEADTTDSLHSTDCDKLPKQPKAVREKPKIMALRWLVTGIAASIALLLVFYLGKNTTEQPLLTAQHPVATEKMEPQHEAVETSQPAEQPLVAQAELVQPKQPTVVKRQVPQSEAVESKPMNADASPTESLADCIARLEAEMDGLDDSVGSAQLEKLIAADARLQQMVNRIVGKQVEQATNEFKRDSIANYISF
ncbi:hypothetical protein [Prevotella sp. E2-28]|uniref:hypothetical protein n=1 Tax=Prevotella sp. E2-28 TaxID=2913620 RepID=UPI001EDAB975|nr:hypothetical protein [Prevotella sp. E2-28]UKK53586.1 hypothetical protein L6465_13580 [Prevotella sp. E2-28]